MHFWSDDETPSEAINRHLLHGGQFQIFASGDVEQGDANRLIGLSQRRGIEWAKVHLESAGGSLSAGLELGETIRALGFDTALGSRHTESVSPIICASAAAYAFAGGVNRFFEIDNACLGIHRFYSDSPLGPDHAQIISGRLVQYLSSMGVDTAAFTLATQASAEEMVWLDRESALNLRFANNGTHASTAEIKLMDGRPYLRLEQVHHNVTARVLLFSLDSGIEMMGGIVTNEEATLEHAGASRSYVELDGTECLEIIGGGIVAEESTVWLERHLDQETLTRLQFADTMELWTENGGNFRWGAWLDLKPLRAPIANFLANCFLTREASPLPVPQTPS